MEIFAKKWRGRSKFFSGMSFFQKTCERFQKIIEFFSCEIILWNLGVVRSSLFLKIKKVSHEILRSFEKFDGSIEKVWGWSNGGGRNSGPDGGPKKMGPGGGRKPVRGGSEFGSGWGCRKSSNSATHRFLRILQKNANSRKNDEFRNSQKNDKILDLQKKIEKKRSPREPTKKK